MSSTITARMPADGMRVRVFAQERSKWLEALNLFTELTAAERERAAKRCDLAMMPVKRSCDEESVCGEALSKLHLRREMNHEREKE